ncbi:MAG: hypothetical protein ACHQNT_00795 [Bacteroidia bacterium]
MKKSYLTILGIFCFLLSISASAFAQSSAAKLEPVLFKINVGEYNDHKTALISALMAINGVTVVKHCESELNRAYLILRVNRSLQPDDNNILAAINSSGIISYKPIDVAQFQYVNQSCK